MGVATGSVAGARSVCSAADLRASGTRQRRWGELEQVRRERRLARSLTLAELVEVYLAQYDVEPVTIEKLRWLLGKAVAVFGEQPVGELRSEEIAASVTVDPDDPDCWYVLASTGPFAAHGRRDPQARIYRRRGGQPWQPLAGGLPEPLPAMPYALVATDSRLFAGLADGQLWESRDRGDNWTALQLGGDTLDALVALDHATR